MVNLPGGLKELRNGRGDVRRSVQRSPRLSRGAVHAKTVMVETRQRADMAKGIPQRREAAATLVDSMQPDVADGSQAWRRVAQTRHVRCSREFGHGWLERTCQAAHLYRPLASSLRRRRASWGTGINRERRHPTNLEPLCQPRHPVYVPAATQPIQRADAGVHVVANEEVRMWLRVPRLHLDGMQVFGQSGIDLGDVRH